MFDGGEDFAFVENGKKLSRRETKRGRIGSPKFWMMRAAHKMLFIEGTLGFKLMKAMSRWAEKRKGRYRFFQVMEHTSKRALFDCRECDDCALFEMYYLCPESRCPKGQRIGPCGGSRVDGSCEVFPERLCIWELVYWRAKRLGELDTLRYVINPRDWRLYETSSWVNYFLGRDHRSAELDIPEKVS
jgi:methylenetetrahydrofolate reductase (NADPH)